MKELSESLPLRKFGALLVPLCELSPRSDDSFEPKKWSKRIQHELLIIIVTYISLSYGYLIKVDGKKGNNNNLTSTKNWWWINVMWYIGRKERTT